MPTWPKNADLFTTLRKRGLRKSVAKAIADAEGADKKGSGKAEALARDALKDLNKAARQVPLKHRRRSTRDCGVAVTVTPVVMEGGIAIFLLFLIIVAALALAFFFGGLGGGLQAYRERRAGRRKPPRPTHAVVHDDGESRAEPGNQL